MASETVIWKRTDMIRQGWERKYYLLFLRTLNRLYMQVSLKITPDNVRSPENLLSEITKEPIERAMLQLYITVGAAFAQDTHSQYVKGDEQLVDDWRARMAGYVKSHLAERLVSITGETRTQALRVMNRVLEAGIEAGEGIDVIARNMQRQLMKDGISVNRFRAARIARTEIVNASNVGSLEGAKSLRMPMEKTWLATRDSRVRDAHGMVDGQTVMLEETFLVDGDNMQGPGDPTASAANVINCRCSLTYRVIR
jgi:hypothetical protein